MALTPNPNAQFERLFKAAADARIPYDREAWLNVAFYLGRQYVEWHSGTNVLRAIPHPKGVQRPIRPVANKIMHFVNQELASVLQSRPTADVLPATDEPIDMSNAAVAKAYLDWLTGPQVADFDATLVEACMWALAGTEGFMKWTWDSVEKRGKITAVSPFDVYPDPYARSWRDCRYIFHSQFLDVEQVYDRYGIQVQPSDIDTPDPTKTAMMREMGFTPNLNGAIVRELWHKPSRRYPDGLFTVWCGRNVLVPPQPFPYAHKHLPFTQIGSVIMPGNLHKTSAVTFLRSPQMELNKFHAQMIQVRENFASPKWWIPTEIDLEADPDDSPNQILRGNSNNGSLQPEILQPTNMPPNDQGAWISTEMMNVVGLHEVSQGQVPGRVEAAQAIQLLKEDDDDRLAEMLRSISSAISEGFWQQLQLAKQYMADDQIVQTYSREGLPEVKQFKKDQIKPGMSVRVSMGTGLSSSRAARSDQLMNMWQQGIIRDPDLMAELIDMPLSSVSPENAFDRKLARNENLQIAAGVAITPNSWDNHEIHRVEHNSYRKTQDYMELSNDSKQKFEYHVSTHDQLEIQQLGQELQRQQMAAQIAAGAGYAAGGVTPPQEGAMGSAPAPPGAQSQATAQDATAADLSDQSQSSIPS